MNKNSDCIRGRKLTNTESVAMMLPDIPAPSEEKINRIIDTFNAVPLVNPVSHGEVKKIDYSIQGCNLDDDDENNNCWNCTMGVFPIGCMVGEEVDV